MGEFEIAAEGRSVKLEVLGRQHPSGGSLDIDWLIAHVKATTGGFSADFAASIRAEDFHDFRRELQALYQDLQGCASFSTMEGQISIQLEALRGGRIRLTSRLAYPLGDGDVLTLAFELDQTYLPPVIKQLESLEAKYPVLGTLNP